MAIVYNKFPEWQGCLSDEQKEKIKQNTDPFKTEPFKIRSKRLKMGDQSICTPGTACLFIGLGGAGVDALYSLKKKFLAEFDQSDYRNRIRFLAVDSDARARFMPGQNSASIDTKTRFDGNEFLWLDNANARKLLNDASTDKWMNAELKNTVNANPSMLTGEGASGIRQLGRLLVLANASALEKKVAELTHQLTNYANAYLEVFIIAGVSGGTGSGGIIDASYIITEAVFKAFNQRYRTRISGMLLLPPADRGNCNEAAAERKNINGYAALKEIDHFMTIANRGENYSCVFGPEQSVTSSFSVFDFCFLLNGELSGISADKMYDGIINMITDTQIYPQGHYHYTPIDYFHDYEVLARHFVEMSDPKIAPRDANYIYNSFSYGKTIIPVDLIKAYVANNVYAFMYNNVYRNYNPNPLALAGAAEAFEDSAMLDYREFTPKGQAAAFLAEIEKIFKTFSPGQQGGPYYIVDLLNVVISGLRYQLDEIEKRRIRFWGKPLKGEHNYQLSFCIDYLTKINSTVFEPLAQAVEEMKNGLLAKSKMLFSRQDGDDCDDSWLFDFAEIDERTEAVINFLDYLIPIQKVVGIADDFANMLWQNKEKWAAIANPQASGSNEFSGSSEFGEFWENSIGKIVEDELENLIIKYYSSNPDAEGFEEADGESRSEAPETGDAVNTAANMIAAKLNEAKFGGPCIEMNSFLEPFYNKYTRKVIQIPERFTRLAEVFEKDSGISVVPILSEDTISLIELIKSIPAFFAQWTKTAESQYEKAVEAGTRGLHMTETKLTDNWVKFPNLLPENIWPVMNGYFNAREKALADEARDFFFRAKELDFAKANKYYATKFNYYDIIVLKEEYRPEIELFKAAEHLRRDTPEYEKAVKLIDYRCEELAQQLFNNKELWQDIITDSREFAIAFDKNYPESTKSVSLAMPNTDLTYPLPANNPEPDPNWAPELAADLLRTRPELLKEVRGTVMVMEKVYAKVIKAQKSSAAILNFVKYLALDMIKYDEEAMNWFYLDSSNGKQILCQMDRGADIQEQIKHYIFFNKYFEDVEKVDEALKDALLDETNIYFKFGPERIGKQKELAAKGDVLKAKIELYASNDSENPIKTVKFKKLCTDEGYDPDAVAKFYKELYAAAGRPMFVNVPKPGKDKKG